MWPFKTPSVPLPTDLIARLEAAEASNKRIRTEWNEMYEKFDRLYARLIQRARRAAEREEREAEQAEAPEPDPTQTTNPLALALLRGMRQ